MRSFHQVYKHILYIDVIFTNVWTELGTQKDIKEPDSFWLAIPWPH